MQITQKDDITIDINGNNIAIHYGLKWLYSVMAVSSKSMVPFKFFTEPDKLENRSYPRSDNPGFFLFKDTQLNTASSAGGRQHVDFAHKVPQLCELFGKKNLDLKIPISDIAIISKRTICMEAVKISKASKHFKILGGTPTPFPLEDKLYPQWPVCGYPLLCIVGGQGGAFTHEKSHTQGEWRVVQCVFGAVLTRLLRERFLGIEVVSREGFGSVFPTLADIPDGIRLDPGLLPPKEGALAIADALLFTDLFISEMQKKGMPKCAIKMNGYDSGPLAAVDRLMSELHSLAQSKPKAGPDVYADIVTRHTGSETECKLDYLDGDVKYGIGEVFPILKRHKFKKIKPKKPLKEKSGYGSDSDYEEDEDEQEELEKPLPVKNENIALEKFKSKKDIDEKELSVCGSLAIKKISVLTGMAALRMATLYGMMYSKWLYTKTDLSKTEEANSHKVTTWAPYFELEHDYGNLWKKVESSPKGIHVLLFDGAPNPINIPDHSSETGSQTKKYTKTSKQKPGLAIPNNLGVIIIDTTNLASWEKAHYLFIFQKYLAQSQNPEQPGGVILMIDSASKHPTGGDLVHGVMRVCGSPLSVETFFNNLLFPHLGSKMTENLNLKEEQNTKSMTVLSEDETEARRMMKDYRLVMRNRDFWQWF